MEILIDVDDFDFMIWIENKRLTFKIKFLTKIKSEYKKEFDKVS